VKFPSGKKYGVIYADPPWSYADVGHDRKITNQYSVMKLADLCALPVAAIAEDDAVLFLWTTSPMLLHEAPAVLDAWGFKYKSSCVWDKERIGMGHYWRIRHELVLLATRGRPGTARDRSIPSVIRQRRAAHSVKPDVVYEHIERMYPDAKKIELFARRRRRGWAAWGDELPAPKARYIEMRRARAKKRAFIG
jgi:N6-adenosine-specific RNA methylase IME4